MVEPDKTTELCYSITEAPKTTCKGMSTAVFQLKFFIDPEKQNYQTFSSSHSKLPIVLVK